MANVAATVNVANGNMVMISTSNEMYNGCAWTVIDAAPRDKPGRIIVASDDVQDDDGEPKENSHSSRGRAGSIHPLRRRRTDTANA